MTPAQLALAFFLGITVALLLLAPDPVADVSRPPSACTKWLSVPMSACVDSMAPLLAGGATQPSDGCCQALFGVAAGAGETCLCHLARNSTAVGLPGANSSRFLGLFTSCNGPNATKALLGSCDEPLERLRHEREPMDALIWFMEGFAVGMLMCLVFDRFVPGVFD